MKTIGKRLFSYMAIASVALFVFTSCEDDDVMPDPAEEMDNIVAIAQATPSLSILVEALSMYPELVSALSADGSYTVFAPTNDAFASLLGVIGQSELKNIPEAVLERVLKYHVIASAALYANDLMDGQEAGTFLSAEDMITVGIDGMSVKINNAMVTTADVVASNGNVHIIDAVLVPAQELSIVNTIVEPAYFNKDFSMLTDAVVKADLLAALIDKEANPTRFAPDNAAFAKAGITSIDGFSKDDLTPILTYHAID